MLQVLKDRGVDPKAPNDPNGAPVQPVPRHCDRAGPGIGREMLKRAGKAGSHDVLRRQQRQKTEEADANPSQEPKRCSEETGAHPRRLSELGGFGKSGPGSLVRGSWAPPFRFPFREPLGRPRIALLRRGRSSRRWWSGRHLLTSRPSRIARQEAPKRSNGAVSKIDYALSLSISLHTGDCDFARLFGRRDRGSQAGAT